MLLILVKSGLYSKYDQINEPKVSVHPASDG